MSFCWNIIGNGLSSVTRIYLQLACMSTPTLVAPLSPGNCHVLLRALLMTCLEALALIINQSIIRRKALCFAWKNSRMCRSG